ncbi:MAG: hypothetical protein QM499_05115 [Flavobacteriaceae bacterium]
MKVNNRAYFILIFVICFSCNKKNTDNKEPSYKVFQQENLGWKSKQIMHFANDIQYRATEVPIEYYLLKNKGKDNKEAIDTLSKKLSKERIIEFEFEHINNDDLLKSEYTTLDYDKSVMYLASTIRNDFMVVTSSNDTIPCSGVHFERHFKISPFKRVLLYFGGINPNETIQLIYRDQLYNNGIFKFKFNEIPFKT